MEIEIKETLKKEETELNTKSPLVWAYIGDSVYELYIRNHLVQSTKLKPHYLHIETIKFVKAQAQAEILKRLQKDLTEEEKEIVRRTRNTQNYHSPKNVKPADYAYATALEGLIGYLYLSGQKERLDEILKLCIKNGKS